ncbi:hypothetical protein TVAG_495960 [Trichomonas vaginalis G3]|uniref:Uncharacterized protein n=1 Tax=Trichomonas vaginalis (strain ATCC PRA-98 / G3) TaxID=412133 RepID=A2DVN5_TRIV3|nr:cilia- and flagella-associated protein 58-related family [Trichomonas vaginalis G3]EAY15577.1 hypothetical protein TVAG_495960 [Trichomonas vaginalis G3]KAI5526223.1 cilia- and flagella-associated protein 58-related family [Trichomonas vaginalis G3]|eukprot:XP_001327800.1 hypothetical protein [Trichomonas vaginalis G3]
MDSDTLSCECSTDLDDCTSESSQKISSLPELESSLLPTKSTPDTSELLQEINSQIDNDELFNEASKILGKPINSSSELLNEIKRFKNLSYKNVEVDFEIQASFLKEFNKYFGVYATNLKDAESYLHVFQDQIKPTTQEKPKPQVDKLSKDREELNRANEQIAKLKNVINNLESQKNSYKSSTLTSDEIQSEADHQLGLANAKISSLQKQIESLEISKALTEHAFADLGNLIESQQKEIASLTVHREKLIKLLKTHIEATKAAFNYKPIAEPPAAKPVIQQPVIQHDDYELNLIFNIVKNSSIPGKIKKEVEDLYTDVRYSEDERITNMITNLCQQIKQYEVCGSSIRKEREEMIKRNNDVEQHLANVLQLFEEQIRFLQKVSRNADLQDALIFRKANPTPMHLDKCTQEELVKKCAVLGKFLEDEMGFLSEEKIKCVLQNSQNIDSNLVFELQKASNIASRLEKLNSMLNTGENADTRELFAVLVAQVFINDALCNLSKELKSKIAYLQREMTRLPQTTKEEVEKYEKQAEENEERAIKIQKLEKQKKKLISTIKELLPSQEQCDNLNQMLKLVVEHKKQLKSSLIILMKENQKLKNSLEVSQERVQRKTKQMKMMGAVIQKQGKIIDENEGKIKDLDKQNNQLKTDIEANNTKHKSEIEQLTKTYDEKEKTMKEQMEKSMSEYEEKFVYLKQEIDAKDRQNHFVNEEKEGLLAEIEQINRKNQESIDKLRETTNQLKQQYETVLFALKESKQEKEQLLQTIDDKNTEIKSIKQQIESLQVVIKANEVKTKTLQEKFDTEKSTIQSQFDVKSNALEAKYNSMKQEMQKQHEDFVSSISRYIQFNDTNELEQKLSELLNFHVKYSQQVSEMENIQLMLNCHGCMKSLSDAVKKIIEEKPKEVTVEKVVYRVDPCVETQAASSRKWEAWARRVLSAVSENRPSNQDTDKMRQCLEEIILSSAHNHVVTDRLVTLRAEKVIMINHTRELLRQRSAPRSKWTTVLPIVLSCMRMMRATGYAQLNKQ